MHNGFFFAKIVVMNIVSLLYNRIQIVSINKPLIGSGKLHKTSVTIPLEDAEAFNLDHWGLQLKKAIELLPPKTLSGKVKLILGQQFWRYVRLELPPDITDSAQDQYIKNQLIDKIGSIAQNSHYKYIVNNYKGKKIAGIYLLADKTLVDITTLLSFYDLKIEEIYPEALLIFTLFEHTLNKQKEEAAMFLEYEPNIATGLLFDSIGLLQEQQIAITGGDLEKKLKQFKKDQKITIARLILGGKLSSTIRQDNFTKESGLWTNPLEKVLQNSSLKQEASKLNLEKEMLQYNREIALINLINNKQHSSYSILIKKGQSSAKIASPSIPIASPQQNKRRGPPKNLLKVIILTLLSFALTFGLITLIGQQLPNLKEIKLPTINSKPTPTSIPIPTKVPTPKTVIQKDQLNIEILNGTGTAGMAGSLQNQLEEIGYKIDSVGNAENYEYENTVIIAKNQQIFNLIAKDLKKFNVSKPTFEQTNDTLTTIIFGSDLKLP